MADDHLLAALNRKYAKLTGELAKIERQAKILRKDMAHVEATIRLFQADWKAENVAPVRPKKPSRWGGRGVCVRLSLDVLRAANEPLTCRQIAVRVLAVKGIEAPDSKTLWAVAGSVSGALNRHVGKGVVAVEGYPKRWALEGVMHEPVVAGSCT